MTKTAKDAANADVSEQTADSEALATTGKVGAVATAEDAPISLGLSEAMREKLSLDLQRTLHQIETGFDALTSPTDIFKMDQPFSIIDGILIEDFVDRTTGEEKSKVVFRLEFGDGRIVNTMQSAARPRKLIAEACEMARSLGGRFKAGPYKFQKKGVGQIQDALIFEQQPGWKAEVYQ